MTIASRTNKTLRPTVQRRSQNYRWFTAEDLEQMPSGLRIELVRGELRKMPPPPGEAHGSTTIRFSTFVTSYVLEHDLGETFAAETGFKIASDPDTVIGPDFAFVAKDRMSTYLNSKVLALAPDLVLETRSPSDRRGRIDGKVQQWLNAGVRLVLELDPTKRLMSVYRPNETPLILSIDDTFFGGEVLPGFTLPIRRLFRDVAGGNKEQS